MNERYLYLFLNLGSVAMPLAFSFYPKANFSKEWRFLFPALFITGVIFIPWDEVFTQLGVWGFNSRYLTGVHIGNLPLEEVLFFFLIPYSCVFIYFSVNHLSRTDYLDSISRYITLCIIVGSALVGALFWNHWYTSVTFFSLSVFLSFHQWVWKSTYIGKFYLSYLIILVPFFLVNGMLTGSWIEEEIVWYNNNENLGIRIGTIPLDDFFYNMLMLLMVITCYEYLKRKALS